MLFTTSDRYQDRLGKKKKKNPDTHRKRNLKHSGNGTPRYTFGKETPNTHRKRNLDALGMEPFRYTFGKETPDTQRKRNLYTM